MNRRMMALKALTKEETRALLTLIEESNIITSKVTNATTNKMKIEEWKRITNKFNSTVKSFRRTPQQLRLKWENLKKACRKRRSLTIPINDIETGDFGAAYVPPDNILDRVAALLSNPIGKNTHLKKENEERLASTENDELVTPDNETTGIKRPIIVLDENNTTGIKKPIIIHNENGRERINKPIIIYNENKRVGIKRPYIICDGRKTTGIQRPNTICHQSKTSEIQRPIIICSDNDTVGIQRPIIICNDNETSGIQRPIIISNENETTGNQSPFVISNENDMTGNQRPIIICNANDTAQFQRPIIISDKNETVDTKRPATSDANRRAKNQTMSECLLIKKKLLEARLENVLLQNEKLKLEIYKLQNNN